MEAYSLVASTPPPPQTTYPLHLLFALWLVQLYYKSGGGGHKHTIAPNQKSGGGGHIPPLPPRFLRQWCI